ncbi:hypothetical protein HMPREF9080_01150 [Cardiobacterium valvarum F0432]|uniref:Uncharacterized protein n=1 Tax=Cardiobacterium valvarum F0432 TaxID=797473 RepID=G9ZEG5_9GAMM|nr:hypothetical protein HMPREF9080_01150 [Cardiobacterium valvarum F0432]
MTSLGKPNICSPDLKSLPLLAGEGVAKRRKGGKNQKSRRLTGPATTPLGTAPAFIRRLAKPAMTPLGEMKGVIYSATRNPLIRPAGTFSRKREKGSSAWRIQ